MSWAGNVWQKHEEDTFDPRSNFETEFCHEHAHHNGSFIDQGKHTYPCRMELREAPELFSVPVRYLRLPWLYGGYAA